MEVNKKDLETVAKNSIRNCHTTGLDSIMFDNTPEARIRCFITSKNHDMWKNLDEYGYFSIAVHSHHCDVKLTPIFGDTYNVTCFDEEKANNILILKTLQGYKFESQINTGKGSFKRFPCALKTNMRAELIKKETPMAAKRLHTVYVPEGKESAWWVYEGKEDKTYDGLAYSGYDLEKFDFSPLYKPMSVDYLKNLLDKLQIKVVE